MPKRVDANQPAVVAAFRARGWTVKPTHELGRGFPDLFLMRRGVRLQIEIKDGSKRPSARLLTLDESAYHAEAAAAGCPVLVVESLADVDRIDQAWRGQA